VDDEMLRRLICRQIEAGVDAIVLGGTTGESPTLTTAEKLDLFRVGVETAAGCCRIIAGTGGNCTERAVELSVQAAQLGVDGLLVVTPYYNKTTQRGLVRHYQAICEAAPVPVIAYNVPSRTGMDIGLEACRELAKLPGIAGIKEASGDITKVGRILAACGEELTVYSGNDDQTVPVMALGGAGVISVASNVIPKQMKALTDACLAGDYARAAALQRRLLPLMDLLFCQVNPIPVKAAMGMIGLDCGDCRMPLDGLTPENAKKLQNCLDQLDSQTYN
jgi:4-hydroxy-tetrahydrodipicolinate synthase